jgi:hypothetical protein
MDAPLRTESAVFDSLPMEDLIAAIDVDYNEVNVPVAALRAAQRRRTEIIPHLIELIRRETRLVRSGAEPTPSSGIFAALLLLTEFKAREALPVIVESLSLPGERAFDLYGDFVTEVFSGVFAELAADAPDVVDRLIADRSLNECVRWEAAQTYLHYIRDGRMTRDAAVERLRRHLARALADADDEIVYGLVCELATLVPHEAMTEIRAAFETGLVDDFGVSLAGIEESVADPDAELRQSLECCDPTGVADAVAELQSWFQVFGSGSVQEEDGSDSADEEYDGYAAPPEPPITIHRTEARVGRNDPCPCGSGKKHKKCCGRA